MTLIKIMDKKNNKILLCNHNNLNKIFSRITKLIYNKIINIMVKKN